jgi:hypothetical protein
MGPGPEGANGGGKSPRPRLREFLFHELVLGAIVLTAVTTLVSVLVTKAIGPDTEARFDESRLAQDAREHFAEGLSLLIKAKHGVNTRVYELLVVQKPEAESAYEQEEWRIAETDYNKLSQELGHACYTEPGFAIPGICVDVVPSAHPSAPPLQPVAPNASTREERETPQHPVDTFSDYNGPAGEGPAIPAGKRIRVSCRVYDPSIESVNPDGYWYRIASAPWNNDYYAPANTFLNGDPPHGPYRHNTDFAVPRCKYKKLRHSG